MTRVVDQSVLVLNRNWQPVAVFSVAVAITTVMREMGWALDAETYELLDFDTWRERAPETARQVKTPSGGVPAPDVIVLKEYSGQPRRGRSFSRRGLYRRDDYACQYCGEQPGAQNLTIDHVQPRSRGGPTSWENCVAACGPCNTRKADQTPREARMPLLSEPRPPRFTPTLTLRASDVRPTWETFVSSALVEVE